MARISKAFPRRLFVVSVLAASLLFASFTLTGCFSRLTGNEGQFTFGYLTDVQIENFNKPIAPGARLDLVAFENGSDDKQYRVVEATSSNPKVLTVASVNGRHAVLEGVAPGSARITMTVRRADGTTLEDSVFMSVAKPTALELAHTCADTPKAAYVASDNLTVPFALHAEDGRAVVGYRYVPVDVEPKGALKFVSRPREFSEIVFRAGPPAEDVRITSKVDDTSLELRLVRRSDVDQIRPEPATLQALTAVGYEQFVGFYPMAGTDPVCQSGMLTEARSLTPDICKVSADLDENGSNWNRAQMARVKGVGFGICRYEITFPEAAGGDGLTEAFTMPVGQFPEGDDAGEPAASVAHEAPERALPWYLTPLLALLASALLAPWAWWWTQRREED
ncbi:Ig-like domain-containing protein [Persicimonas caeni]|uniref:Ig-like domain-containing protein n=1 Tax=Persicimonas caeni TaxID=2292766 RepID=UPI00143D9110|nr:Ig-like domain-containing protein [Persicimonas caeni]